MELPSNQVPWRTDPSSWWIGMVTALTWPMMSVNWSWTKRMPRARAASICSMPSTRSATTTDDASPLRSVVPFARTSSRTRFPSGKDTGIVRSTCAGWPRHSCGFRTTCRAIPGSCQPWLTDPCLSTTVDSVIEPGPGPSLPFVRRSCRGARRGRVPPPARRPARTGRRREGSRAGLDLGPDRRGAGDHPPRCAQAPCACAARTLSRR